TFKPSRVPLDLLKLRSHLFHNWTRCCKYENVWKFVTPLYPDGEIMPFKDCEAYLGESGAKGLLGQQIRI
ncbi:MAG: hypothetical protein ABSH41_08445, partial [Syntrophobacteraceae bacterium]